MESELSLIEIDMVIPDGITSPEWDVLNSRAIPADLDSGDPLDPNSNDDSDSDSSDSMTSINLDDGDYTSKLNTDYLLSVSVAESVTAGALSNKLCSEPGSSKFFLGGIVAYNMETQKKLLDIDEKYAELNNFANPFTTYTMAKNVTGIFQSRIWISTTGFSLPTYREADLENGKCEINVSIPYAYVCLYDALLENAKIYKLTNDFYSAGTSSQDKKIQRAQMQAKVALQCKKIFEKYCIGKSTSR